MKIVIQSFNYHPHELGGAERSARDLARGLAERGHNISILLSDGSVDYPETVDGMAINVIQGLPLGKSPLADHRTYLDRILWILRSEIDVTLLFSLVRFLWKEKPDCLLINNPAGHGSALMIAASIARVPVLPVLRDYSWFCAFGVMVRDGKNCDSLCKSCAAITSMRRRSLRDQSCIAISDYVADLAMRHVPKVNLQVISNSVRETFLNTPRAEKPVGPALNFGFLGRLHPTKGLDVLLNGWRNAELWQQGHRLLIAGDPTGYALPDAAERPGVDFVGRQDPIAFLDQLDVLFVPSLWGEPFGRTVIEGIARRVYVVGSPEGAIPSLIAPGAGEVLQEMTADAISETLKRLTSDHEPIRAIRARDPAELLSAFRYSNMIDLYEAAISERTASRAAL